MSTSVFSLRVSVLDSASGRGMTWVCAAGSVAGCVIAGVAAMAASGHPLAPSFLKGEGEGSLQDKAEAMSFYIIDGKVDVCCHLFYFLRSQGALPGGACGIVCPQAVAVRSPFLPFYFFTFKSPFYFFTFKSPFYFFTFLLFYFFTFNSAIPVRGQPPVSMRH